jgi:multiple sugar transport system ATP-binding protein
MTMGDRIAVMNEGKLQQLDTPQNLYDHPGNRFVATFIGSPAMNVFPASVSNGTERLVLNAGDFTITVPASRAGRLKDRVGQNVMIGVRPEHIQTRQFAENVREDNTIKLPVELVEPLGSETLLHLKGPTDSIVAKVDPRTDVKAGDIAELTINLEHLHAFDPVSEEVLI